MCVSHPDEEEPITSPKGGHKRNLSNGTPENSPLRRTKRQKSRVSLKEASSSEESEPEAKPTPKKASRAKKTQAPSSVKKEEADETEPLKSASEDQVPKVEEEEDSGIKPKSKATATPAKAKPAKRVKKTKEEKEVEAMPLAPRTPGLRMFVGAHVSAAKGESQPAVLPRCAKRPLTRAMSRPFQLNPQY